MYLSKLFNNDAIIHTNFEPNNTTTKQNPP